MSDSNKSDTDSPIIKMVRKFTSFEDLKSCEGKTVDDKLSLKKHKDFEKVIKSIYSVKVPPVQASR